jgi:hypothetical protein
MCTKVVKRMGFISDELNVDSLVVTNMIFFFFLKSANIIDNECVQDAQQTQGQKNNTTVSDIPEDNTTKNP